MTVAKLATHVTRKAPDAQHLRLYNLYRIAASGTLLGSQIWPYFYRDNAVLPLIFWTLVGFFVYALVMGLRYKDRTIRTVILKLQTVFDLGFIIFMMHVLSDSQNTISLLLLVNVVFASLIASGRDWMFYAAIATIGILLENTYHLVNHTSQDFYYTNAVILSLSCFATAWLSHTLSTRMQSSETLATQRGHDIEHLARINALITQEMPNGVLVIDQHQQLKHYNLHACKLLGLEESHLQQMLERQAQINQALPNLVQLLSTSADDTFAPQDARKLSMNNRDLGIRFRAIEDDIQKGVVIFIEDWSQIQTQAHQVKLAALGRLTANIAHEIRNPLSAISHANQLLQEDATEPGTHRMCQIISDNVHRLDQMIKDVLELNRRDRTNQERFDVQHFVQEFYQQFCAVERIDQADFTLVAPSPHCEVVFDRRHINQILWNLCKNGWRHSKQQHNSLQLRVSSDKSGQFVQLFVTDDGSGIDAKIQPHLFEPFMTTEKTGTGLGLFIARELAEANGARLNFISAANGTEFSLTIKKALA